MVKEKFHGAIDVKLGFKTDFPMLDTFKRSYLTDPRVDFITGSVHFIGDWGVDNPDQVERYNDRPIDDIYRD